MSTKASLRFDVYRNNFVFRFADRHGIGFLGLWLWALLFLLGGKLLLTSAYGTLLSGSIPTDIVRDATNMPLLAALLDAARLGGSQFGALLPVDWGGVWRLGAETLGRDYVRGSSASLATNLPYLRDYVDMAAMVLMSLNVALVRHHWRLISDLPAGLWDGGAIDESRITRDQLQSELDHYDEITNRPVWDWLLAALAAVVSVSFNMALLHSGMYPRLAESGVDHEAWQRDLAIGWWAHPDRGALSFGFQLLVIGLICYLIFRHNFVGFQVVRLAKRLMSDRGEASGAPFLRIQPQHLDGCSGLQPLKKVLVHVYVSILVMAATLFLLLYYLPEGGSAVATPLFLLFVVANPAYVILPLKYVQKDLRESKDSLCRGLESEMKLLKRRIRPGLFGSSASIGAVPGKGGRARMLGRRSAQSFERRRRLVYPSSVAYLALNDELTAAREASTYVFSLSQSVVFAATYIIPLALFVLEVRRI